MPLPAAMAAAPVLQGFGKELNRPVIGWTRTTTKVRKKSIKTSTASVQIRAWELFGGALGAAALYWLYCGGLGNNTNKLMDAGEFAFFGPLAFFIPGKYITPDKKISWPKIPPTVWPKLPDTVTIPDVTQPVNPVNLPTGQGDFWNDLLKTIWP